MKKLTLIIMIMGTLIMTNAQIEKNELKITPKIEEALLEPIYWLINKADKEIVFSDLGIKNRSQLEKTHFGKAIPVYEFGNENEGVVGGPIPVYNIRDEEFRFAGRWLVPVLLDGEFLFIVVAGLSASGECSFGTFIPAKIAKRIYNYENKDMIIGSLIAKKPGIPSYYMDYLIIRKENQDVFVPYDDETQEWFKNEYSLSEVINHIEEERLAIIQALKSKTFEKVNPNFDSVTIQKYELKITPEITDMLDTSVFSRIKTWPDKKLPNFGIKNRSQLENLHLGKPIPMYVIENENLKFRNRWQILVMSNDEPLFLVAVAKGNDGQYNWAGSGSANMAGIIHNYEYKDLIVGFLEINSPSGMDYLIIKKENQVIFVQVYDYETRQLFKNEYDFSEIINLIKE